MKKIITLYCEQCPNRQQPLMSCCQLDELAFISENKRSHSYQKGERIFHEGSPALGLHCVLSGKIKIVKTGGDDKEQIIRLSKGGDMLGFRSVLAETHYSTSAVALEECIVCFIPRADFFRVWQSNLQFSVALMQIMAKELGQAEAQMLNLAYKPVRERLAEALLMLYQTFRTDEEVTPFAIGISREDLAALVGTAKETATRLLSTFREEGIVATHGSQITILRVDRLTQIATLYA